MDHWEYTSLNGDPNFKKTHRMSPSVRGKAVIFKVVGPTLPHVVDMFLGRDCSGGC